jgi:hypothetical protein
VVARRANDMAGRLIERCIRRCVINGEMTMLGTLGVPGGPGSASTWLTAAGVTPVSELLEPAGTFRGAVYDGTVRSHAWW